MSEMIDRVALALRSDTKCISLDGDAYWLHVARTAISAMREPTEDMIKAPEDYLSNSHDHWRWLVKEVWHAMIDKALK